MCIVRVDVDEKIEDKERASLDMLAIRCDIIVGVSHDGHAPKKWKRMRQLFSSCGALQVPVAANTVTKC